jgi:hypothetical protein
MATEEDRQDERDRMGNDPLHAPPATELVEEKPVESPAQPAERDAEPQRDSPEERASISMESERNVAKSAEGLTVGGTEKKPAAQSHKAKGRRKQRPPRR